MIRFSRWSAQLRKNAVDNQSGATALTFGLLLFPLIATVGLGIDFGNVMTMRTKAQMAADAAALQATGVARDLVRSGGGGAAAWNSAIADAKTRATALFNAHAKQSGLKDYDVDLTVVRDGQKILATAGFTVRSPNFIAQVFGHNSFTARGGAVSSASLPIYSDVYLALDISQSMGIAATSAGMKKLYSSTSNMVNSAGYVQQFDQPIKCVFGCHTKKSVDSAPHNGKGYYWAETFSQVAKRVGVDLRIDVLRNAVKDMLVAAQKEALHQPIYRFAFYTMGATSTKTQYKLTELSALSSDFAALTASANGIDMTDSIGSTAESYISENLEAFAGKVDASGDGSDQSKARRYAFIVTDGLRNIKTLNSSTCYTGNGRCVSTVTARSTTGLNASCEALKKNKNVTVGVLYTTYVPINPIDTTSPQRNWYDLEVVQNIKDMTTLAKDLEKCASPGWFFQATEKAEIEAAMVKMFAQTTNAPTLTN